MVNRVELHYTMKIMKSMKGKMIAGNGKSLPG
jgi:hypothetical protein